MKTRFFSIVSVILCCLVAGCNATVHKDEEQFANVTFGVYSQNSRTAIADVNFSDYTYTLQAIEGYGSSEQKDMTVLFNGRSYAKLSEAVALTPANYRFLMYAVQDGKNILSGVAEADLSAGNASVQFTMYPCTGAKGNAEVTINVPGGGKVASAKAFHSTTPVRKIESVPAEDVTVLELSAAEGGLSSTFTLTGLSSGTSNYAIIYLYDSHGGVISTFAESLMVIGNLTCRSTLVYTEDDLFTYAVTVTLEKNGERWGSSGKKLSLVSQSDPSVKYALKDTSGFFSGSVAQDTYHIYSDDVDTGISFASQDEVAVVDYYTVSLVPTTGFTLEAVAGGTVLYDGTILLLKNEPFTYKAALKKGYSSTLSFAVKANSSIVTQDTSKLSQNLSLAGISQETELTVVGASPTVYTITYNLENGSDYSWKAGYSKPVSFTVTDDIDLPTAVEYKRSGYLLDGWTIVGGENNGVTIGYIHADTYFSNLTLAPKWKTSVFVDTVKKVIYANGISLLIQENPSNTSETYVYLDINGNGNIDSGDGDIQVVADNGTKNFSGYSLEAGNKDPAVVIASDFTFTMKGGTIASITGLGAEKHNRSILNISGNSKIGSVEENDEGEFVAVAGVDLKSIYNQKVYITGQMNGDYKVVLISQYEYERLTPHYVAEIGNSTWASFKQFSCFKDEGSVYKKLGLTMKDVKKNDVTSTAVLLSNPQPIALPTAPAAGDGSSDEGNADSIIGDVNEGFSVGDNRISIECSVFSISVENGSFKVPRTTFTLNESASEVAIEGTLTYLAQPTPDTYEETLALDRDYVYMHIMSEGNQITPELASEFLSGVIFKRSPETPDVPVKVKVNLETVPSVEIKNAGVTYFDGSFYKYISSGSSKISWENSYNQSKSQVFNGLNGYLMTVSSDVENFYIFNKITPPNKLSWMGGARLRPKTFYDDKVYTTDDWTGQKAGYEVKSFYWQCGPEAGQMFYNAVKGPANDAASKTAGDVYKDQDGNIYTNDEKNALVAAGSDKIFSKVFTKWNNDYLYYFPQHGSTKKTEPNNSPSNEACVQFLSGSLSGIISNGYWNDQAYNSTSADYGCSGFIVEFTPYKNAYNEEIASCQSIMTTASY